MSAVAILAGVVVGCGIFDSDMDTPETATVLLDGPPGASVLLVTSISLLTGGGANEDGSVDVQFESADTLVVTLPYEADYAIAEREGQYNFYAGAGHVGEGNGSLLVHMLVLIDGDVWYDQELDVADRPHGFIYRR